MFIKKLPHILTALLIGIMIGCGSSNPLIEEAQSNIESKNYEGALASAERSINEYPSDPLGYYYKGVALSEIAGTKKDPSQRTDLYEQMNESFLTAKSIADTLESSPGEIGRISAVKQVLWRTEHNLGYKYATDDSLKGTVENPLEYSVQHFKNATIIAPDSTLSWNVLSQVAAMNSEFETALDAKNSYLKLVDDTTATPNDYLQLARYHFELQQPDKVVDVLERAYEKFPKNKDIVTNLADQYSNTGQSDKAISTVENLVEMYPDSSQYRLSLGTQIYQKALKLGDTLSANSEKIVNLQDKLNNASGSEATSIKQQIQELSSENKQLQSEIEDLTQRAEDELLTVIEQDSDNANAHNTLGVIYQNRAITFFDLRNQTDNNAQAAEYDQQGKDLLRQAMEYYENAAEIEPDNQGYWKSLFRVYTTLGMDQKAKEAMQKAGMN